LSVSRLGFIVSNWLANIVDVRIRECADDSMPACLLVILEPMRTHMEVRIAKSK
jgi:hypothetical protein